MSLLDSAIKRSTNQSTSGRENSSDMGSNNELVTITNPDIQVTLPVLKYGYRTTKATWEELVRIIEVEKDIPKMSRSREQQHHYEVFRHHMKEQYRSTLDFILISKFGFDEVFAYDSAGGSDGDNSAKTSRQRRMADPGLEDVPNDGRKRIILVENDFPYYVEENIVHYVLWKLKEPITPQEIVEARGKLRSEPIRALEILEWVNPPNLKSIPEIDHVHFLCKLGTKE